MFTVPEVPKSTAGVIVHVFSTTGMTISAKLKITECVLKLIINLQLFLRIN
jgi:hypothetical protein